MGCDPTYPTCSSGCQDLVEKIYYRCDGICLPNGYFFDPRKPSIWAILAFNLRMMCIYRVGAFRLLGSHQGRPKNQSRALWLQCRIFIQINSIVPFYYSCMGNSDNSKFSRDVTGGKGVHNESTLCFLYREYSLVTLLQPITK
jgi:hypothetical protein